MVDPASVRTTQLLALASQGDARATDELLALVYDELRRMAASQMGRERAGNTLQPTALVHEAYMRLIGDGDVRWNGRGHFFAAAAQAMRRILVERARSKARVRHGGGRVRIDLGDESDALANLVARSEDDEMLDIDDALRRLEEHDPQVATIVMLRFFTGLTIEETAAALDISFATVRAGWLYARAWMHRELAKDLEGG